MKEAVLKLYLTHGKLSPSFLQRKLRITFKKAQKFILELKAKHEQKED